MYERIIEGIARYDLACVIVVTIPMPVIIIAVPCGGTAEFELIPDKCDIIQIRHSPVAVVSYLAGPLILSNPLTINTVLSFSPLGDR